MDLSKLPDDASDTLRIVRIGDYDACACIGSHVANTSEIGHFKLLNYDYADGRLRLRFNWYKFESKRKRQMKYLCKFASDKEHFNTDIKYNSYANN